jgi:cytochrome c5
MGFIFFISGLSGFLFSLYTHGEIRQKNPVHHPDEFVKQLVGDPDAGKKIFNEFCASCHAPKSVINTHAPRIGDQKSWEGLQRIGMPTLLTITKQGVPPMPPRGGCFECSDEQLKQTIQYMLDQSRHE